MRTMLTKRLRRSKSPRESLPAGTCIESEPVSAGFRDRPGTPSPLARPGKRLTANLARWSQFGYAFRTTEWLLPSVIHSSESDFAGLASYLRRKSRNSGWSCTLEPGCPADMNCRLGARTTTPGVLGPVGIPNELVFGPIPPVGSGFVASRV